uniref:Uncharacterized protein n=1 Tax=Arundo donax TaxID=35708 RepID=A0A0A9BSW5_ARUDO
MHPYDICNSSSIIIRYNLSYRSSCKD